MSDASLPVFFINLDSAVDRRAFMEAQLAALGLECERFPAITEPSLVPKKPPSRAEHRGPLTKGELSCFESHVTLWQRVVREQKWGVIMEDDVTLHPRIGDFIRALPRSLPTLVDVLRLETTGGSTRLGRGQQIGQAQIKRVMQPQFCAGAYVITPTAAARLLSTADEFGLVPVDLFLFDRPAIYDMRIYQVVPPMAVQPDHSRLAAERMPWHRSALAEERSKVWPPGRPNSHGLPTRLLYWLKSARSYPFVDCVAGLRRSNLEFAIPSEGSPLNG